MKAADSHRLKKTALLSGLAAEAQLQSRISWLMDMKQSQQEIAEAIQVASPNLGKNILESLRRTEAWMASHGLSERMATSEIFRRSALENIQPTMRWLLASGLSQQVAVRLISSVPRVLSFEKKSEALGWRDDLGLDLAEWAKVIVKVPDIDVEKTRSRVQELLDLGLQKDEVAKMIDRYPQILACDLQGSVAWLRQWDLSQDQILQVMKRDPRLLDKSLEAGGIPQTGFFQKELGLPAKEVGKMILWTPYLLRTRPETLKLTVSWLGELGLTDDQVAQAIVKVRGVLSLNLENKLKPKVQWLRELGLKQNEVATFISTHPRLLQYSLGKLRKRQKLFERTFGKEAVAEVVEQHPRMFYEMNSERFRSWMHRYEVHKISFPLVAGGVEGGFG